VTWYGEDLRFNDAVLCAEELIEPGYHEPRQVTKVTGFTVERYAFVHRHQNHSKQGEVERLCVDEVGDLSCDSCCADLLFEVITRRYDVQRPLLLSTKKAFSEWSEAFPHEPAWSPSSTGSSIGPRSSRLTPNATASRRPRS
jgi:hypothetical protein